MVLIFYGVYEQGGQVSVVLVRLDATGSEDKGTKGRARASAETNE